MKAIVPVYKICSACLGEGVVESMTHPASSLDTNHKFENVQCVSCDGLGYVPTGDFIYNQTDMPFTHDLENVRSEKVKMAIKRKI